MSVSTDNFYNAEDQYKEFYGISPDTDIGDDARESFIPTDELNDSHYKDLRILTEEIERLKVENERLVSEDETLEDTLASLNFFKEQCIELKNEKQKAMEPWLGDDWEETTLADWADDIEKQKAEITDDSQREIEALKEQAEDSFQAIAEALCGEGDEADSIAGWGQGHQIVKRIEDLKEENEELKEDQLYYRLYLYTADPGGSWSGPEKEDVDRFTDDPVMRKILYEKIGYESDDESDED